MVKLLHLCRCEGLPRELSLELTYKIKIMKNFGSSFLAALLAFVVGNLLLVVLSVLFFAGMVTLFSDQKTTSEPHSILRLELSSPITDRPSENPFAELNPLSMRFNAQVSLLDLLQTIDRAASDPHIEGIYLHLSPSMQLGMATLTEIRGALVRFKESGKFVVSYNELYTQGGYYLSSVADQLYLNPEGMLSWSGLSSNTLFYKGLLQKLGVEPQVIRHGSYKAAVEPYILDRMSPENREQTTHLLGTIWGQLLSEIALSRGLDSADLQRYAADLTLTHAQAAVQVGMVDSVLYQADLDTILCAKSGATLHPNYLTLGEYMSTLAPKQNHSENQIAILYAQGTIVDGKGTEGQVGSRTLAEELATARGDSAVKAVVLRINSPGGSALASEVMWHEVELLRQRKPVVVSMGNVAASGGYYIAAPGDAILASPTTITGSIGVFGLLFNAEQGLRDKLGIAVDVVKTNPSADLGSPFRALTPPERHFMQQHVERVYTTFVDHVAAGRNLTTTRVDSLASGRVWSGVSALNNGLIDGYGGIQEAIRLAAERAGVADDFRLTTPTQSQEPLVQLLRLITAQIRTPLSGEMGEISRHLEQLQQSLSQSGVQARMPYDLEIR